MSDVFPIDRDVSNLSTSEIKEELFGGSFLQSQIRSDLSEVILA